MHLLHSVIDDFSMVTLINKMKSVIEYIRILVPMVCNASNLTVIEPDKTESTFQIFNGSGAVRSEE